MQTHVYTIRLAEELARFGGYRSPGAAIRAAIDSAPEGLMALHNPPDTTVTVKVRLSPLQAEKALRLGRGVITDGVRAALSFRIYHRG